MIAKWFFTPTYFLSKHENSKQIPNIAGFSQTLRKGNAQKGGAKSLQKGGATRACRGGGADSGGLGTGANGQHFSCSVFNLIPPDL